VGYWGWRRIHAGRRHRLFRPRVRPARQHAGGRDNQHVGGGHSQCLPAATHAVRHNAQHLGPVATVRACFKAINRHHYGRAWRLGGRNTGGSYAAFVSGFEGTEHDTVTVQSVSGNVVRARLAARQTDGSVKTYEGTYRVSQA
jgi:hypothetical protein